MQRKRFAFDLLIPFVGTCNSCRLTLFLCVALCSWWLRISVARWVWNLRAPICAWATADSSRSSPSLSASAAKRWATQPALLCCWQKQDCFLSNSTIRSRCAISKQSVTSTGVGCHSGCSHAPVGVRSCEDRRHRGLRSPKRNGKCTRHGIIKRLHWQMNKNTIWVFGCLRMSQILPLRNPTSGTLPASEWRTSLPPWWPLM